MSQCEGRTGGVGVTVPCPDSTCDSSVVNRQGDSMLCELCAEARFPGFYVAAAMASQLEIACRLS